MSLLQNELFNTDLSSWSTVADQDGNNNAWSWTSDFGNSAFNVWSTVKAGVLSQAYTLNTSIDYRLIAIIQFEDITGTFKQVYQLQRTFIPPTARSNIGLRLYGSGSLARFQIIGFDTDLTNPANYDILVQGTHTLSFVNFANMRVTSVELENAAPGGGEGPAQGVFEPGLIISPGAPYSFDINRTLYNSQSEYGVKFPCFYQPLNCDDKITLNIKFGSTFIGSYPQLRIINAKTGSEIARQDFVNITDPYVSPSNTNYWTVDYDPTATSPNPICNKDICLEVWEVIDSPSFQVKKATSEPIRVKQSWPGSLLIKYYNQNDAFDMGYGEQSPPYENWLRVQATFWKQQFPQTQSQYRKSNGELVRLTSRIERRRVLETTFMPYYMHQKLIIALTHSYVDINSDLYIKEEDYSIEQNEKYALQRGSVVLTNATYYKETII
jgi:hypothetical protein